jgi:hypothetical protein
MMVVQNLVIFAVNSDASFTLKRVVLDGIVEAMSDNY